MSEDSGSVSHKIALDKAKTEYIKFIAQNPSPVEREYLETIKLLSKKGKKQIKNIKFAENELKNLTELKKKNNNE